MITTRNLFKENYQKSKMSDIVEIVEISSGCIETYPCVLSFTYKDADGNIHNGELDGVQLVELLQEKNLEIPSHFKEYINFDYTFGGLFP